MREEDRDKAPCAEFRNEEIQLAVIQTKQLYSLVNKLNRHIWYQGTVNMTAKLNTAQLFTFRFVSQNIRITFTKRRRLLPVHTADSFWPRSSRGEPGEVGHQMSRFTHHLRQALFINLSLCSKYSFVV